MRFGVMASGQMPDELPDPKVFRDIATLAEDAGFDSLWAGDHLSFGNPIVEGIVAISAFAGYTRSITLGTGVLLLPLRHPALVAKQVASLDYLVGGRLIFGVGVGGDSAKDFEAVQIPREERGARTSEGIDVLRALWSRESASHSGRFYEFEDVSLNPLPTQLGGPPIWIGGRADAALRRAGTKADGWIAYMVSPDRFAKSYAAVQASARDTGRDPTTIVPAMMVPTKIGTDGDAARESLRRHLSERYHREFSPEQITKLCLAGTAEELIDRIGEYAAAGVQHLVFLSGGAPTESLDQFSALHQHVVTAIT